MTTNFLTAHTIERIMTDQTIDEVGRTLLLATISLFGPDAPRLIKERALAIGRAASDTTKDLEQGAGDGYPHGFIAAYMNKSLNNSLGSL